MNVDYSYEKDESRKLTNEKLKINDEIVIIHQSGQLIYSTLKGTENLNKKLHEGSNLSALKYIDNNANLDLRTPFNKTFKQFMKFISEMLFFRSLLDQVAYIGFTNSSSNIYKDILQRDNLKDFESFLNEMGIECKLSRCEDGGEPTIGFNLHGKIIPISAIASTGTKNLVLFYYWWQQIKDNKVSFLFIDEFDAFYHFKLSNAIVKRLKQLDTQVILTTHNTALLSNELIRPDCGFILDGITIKSLVQGTEKELRNAHNLEKLYRAGLFTGESNG